ncbi:MAG: hypothetical protein M1814_004953 [Vezdaea aestivalis]|nr:MAG: hypothetical protein M1814_004953 [Vezdaea aestivalis]
MGDLTQTIQVDEKEGMDQREEQTPERNIDAAANNESGSRRESMSSPAGRSSVTADSLGSPSQTSSHLNSPNARALVNSSIHATTTNFPALPLMPMYYPLSLVPPPPTVSMEDGPPPRETPPSYNYYIRQFPTDPTVMQCGQITRANGSRRHVRTFGPTPSQTDPRYWSPRESTPGRNF